MTEWLFTKIERKRLCRLHEHITAVKERVVIRGTNAENFTSCKIDSNCKVIFVVVNVMLVLFRQVSYIEVEK